MKQATQNMSKATNMADRGSAFPCPYGWFLSGGRAAVFKPSQTKKEEAKSTQLSAAPATTATLLPKIPAENLTIDKMKFTTMLYRMVRWA